MWRASKYGAGALFLLSMLLISRSMDLWKILPYVQLIKCCFHLYFNGIAKKTISSQNMTNPIGSSMDDIVYKCHLLSNMLKNFFSVYFL